MSDEPLLLHFHGSYADEKVLWALDHARWPHRRRALVPLIHRPGELPALIVGGVPWVGAARILEELERRGSALFPTDPAERARAEALVRWLDEELAPDVQRLFWAAYLDRPLACARMAAAGGSALARAAWIAGSPVLRRSMRRAVGADPESLARARSRLPAALERLEAAIGPSGFLVGARFGIADVAAAAALAPLVQPPELPRPVPEPWPAALVELRRSLADRPAVRWVEGVYRRHRGRSAEGIGALSSGPALPDDARDRRDVLRQDVSVERVQLWLRQRPFSAWALTLGGAAMALGLVGWTVTALAGASAALALALGGPGARLRIRVDQTRIEVRGWSGRWFPRPFRWVGPLVGARVRLWPVEGTRGALHGLELVADGATTPLVVVACTPSEAQTVIAAIDAAREHGAARHGAGQAEIPAELSALRPTDD